MYKNSLHLLLVTSVVALLSGEAIAKSDSAPRGRNDGPTIRQQSVVVEYFNRNHKMRLYSAMLSEAGYQAAEPQVESKGVDCTVAWCRDIFDVTQSFTSASGNIILGLGVGLWQDAPGGFVWDLNGPNMNRLGARFMSFYISHETTGNTIAAGITGFFADNMPSYIADSADNGYDYLTVSLRNVTCVGSRQYLPGTPAECVFQLIGGDEVVVTGARASRIYTALHSPRITSPGRQFGRDVINVGLDQFAISIPNVICLYAPPDQATVPGGSCNFLQPL